MKAVERLLGGTLDEQRKLRNVLRAVYTLTAHLNRLPPEQLPPYLRPHLPLTLAFGPEILQLPDQQRQLLVNLVRDRGLSAYQRQYWRFFSHLGSHELHQLTQSSWNIFQFLLEDQLTQHFFGATTTLDLPKLLQDGTSLICWLPVGANLSGARLIGKYLTTKLQHSAYRRPPEQRRQTLHLYLDEFHQWTDLAWADALTNLRQFGIAVTCAHQSQSQPPFDTAEGLALLRTIQANSRLKVLFRLARPDAEHLVKELFIPSQQKPNHKTLDHTLGVSEQQGSTQGTSRTDQQSTQHDSGSSHSQRTVFGGADGGDQLTLGRTTKQTVSVGQRTGFTRSETITSGKQRSVTRRQIYYSLEGERELAINAVQQLPPRQFFFSYEALSARLVEAPFVPDELYSYAALDLPAELMAWQRAELALETPAPPALTDQALVMPASKSRLAAAPSGVTLETALATASLEPPAEDVVEAQVVPPDVDPDDPFVD